MSDNYNHRVIDKIIDQIAASGALGVGERQVALLRYLVSEEIAGRGDHIKAYTIGTNVLGRAASFDPSQDAIVRVEIGRLRKTLDLYFATQGRQSEYVIVIDKGTYRPRILDRAAGAIPSPDAAGQLEPSGTLARETFPPRKHLPLILGALACLFLAAIAGLFYLTRSSHDPARIRAPLVLVQTPEIAGVAERADGLRLTLQTALVQELRARNWLLVSLADTAITSQGFQPRPVFRLRTYMAVMNDHYLLTAILAHESGNNIIWTGRFEGEFELLNSSTFEHFIAESIASDLADLNGPLVESIAVQSEMTSAHADTAFRCMINARRYLRFNTPKQFRDSKTCLRRLVDQDPSQVKLRALLVYLTVEEAITPHLSSLANVIGGRDVTTQAERRDALLQEAEDLLDNSAPGDRFMLAARLTLAACRGQTDIVRTSILALRTLQSKNPDAYIAVGLLAGPFLGEWPLAISAEARAFSLNANPLPWYQFISAIKAANDDDPGLALRMLSRAPMHNNAIGNAMIVAFGAEAGANLRVINARSNLMRLGYGDMASLEALVDSSCYSETVKNRIKRGLLRSINSDPLR